VDAAYLAGLVDGEGTVALSHKHRGEHRQLLVSISNTERQILDFGRAQLVIDHYVRLTPRNGKYSDSLRAERDRFVNAFLRLRADVSSEVNARNPFGLAAEGDVGGGGGTADSTSFEVGWTMPSS